MALSKRLPLAFPPQGTQRHRIKRKAGRWLFLLSVSPAAFEGQLGDTGFADVPQKLTVVAQLRQNRFCLVKSRLRAAAHQVERSLSRLRYAGSHARLQRLSARLLRQFLYLNVNFRRDRSAVDEDFASGAFQQVV